MNNDFMPDSMVLINLILLAFLTGGGLALSGLFLQSVFFNSLADPYLLGVCGGSSLGYVAVNLLPIASSPMLSFTGSLLGSFGAILVLFIVIRQAQSSSRGGRIVLAGVVFNSLCFGVVLTLMTLAPHKIQTSYMNIMTGHIDFLNWPVLTLVALFYGIIFYVAYKRSRVLDVLSLGEERAQILGVATKKEQMFWLGMTSLLVAVSVATCGMIGFLGLIVPNLIRMITKANSEVLMQRGFIWGGIYLVVCLMLSQLSAHLLAPKAIPISVIATFLGAPLYLLIMIRGRYV